MNTPNDKTVNTPYGTVNANTLHTLEDSYDTAGLLRMVDQLDAIRARLGGIDGARDDLLRLHAMAHTVVNGARLVVPNDGTSIWEAADELVSEFKDWSRAFAGFARQLEPLAALTPQDGDAV
ncbi:Tn3 family transposase post-transcriptional regulator TnpC [Collimonas antrihumi]|uniref:Tn3 family transposase post-transcriptional regulator TnpC n=1 Tax=Collimonas antrihumi TaxID=1940615 RepID=UPI001B8B8F1F|nr:Tn3 family transposase post-transcriptional regulator TnpC [Collimonas antrihumi]